MYDLHIFISVIIKCYFQPFRLCLHNSQLVFTLLMLKYKIANPTFIKNVFCYQNIVAVIVNVVHTPSLHQRLKSAADRLSRQAAPTSARGSEVGEEVGVGVRVGPVEFKLSLTGIETVRESRSIAPPELH